MRTSWTQGLVVIECYCRHGIGQLHHHRHSSWLAFVALTSSVFLYGGTLRNKTDCWSVRQTQTCLLGHMTGLTVCYRRIVAPMQVIPVYHFSAPPLLCSFNPGIYLIWDLFHLAECLSQECSNTKHCRLMIPDVMKIFHNMGFVVLADLLGKRSVRNRSRLFL